MFSFKDFASLTMNLPLTVLLYSCWGLDRPILHPGQHHLPL